MGRAAHNAGASRLGASMVAPDNDEPPWQWIANDGKWLAWLGGGR
jgi:hypothetical protein